MRKVTLLLMTLVAITSMATGQVDVSAVNKPIELLNEANTDIENGDYKDAVQKLIAANRLNPKLREVYSSLNTACTHTNQISLLKEFLVKGKGIFEEDDELCYYLGNIYQNQQNYAGSHKGVFSGNTVCQEKWGRVRVGICLLLEPGELLLETA